jgi:hypothetical protein
MRANISNFVKHGEWKNVADYRLDDIRMSNIYRLPHIILAFIGVLREILSESLKLHF